MGKNSQKDDNEYIELPKATPDEIFEMISPSLSKFSKIKDGEIETDTFEEIINIEKDRLMAFINALPESNTPIISTVLSFISVLIGFFIAQQQFNLGSLLVLVMASFLSIWGLLVLEIFSSSHLERFFFITLFMELLPATLTLKRGRYVTFLHSKEFDPLIKTIKEYPDVKEYFEKIYFESRVYPEIKSVQFLSLFHLFLFLLPTISLFVSLPPQDFSKASMSLLAFFGYFEISIIALGILASIGSKDIYHRHKNKIVLFYIISWIISLVILEIAKINLWMLALTIVLFAILYILISTVLYYFVKSQNIKRLLVISYDTLNSILSMLKMSHVKHKLLRELDEYLLLVHEYFRSRMYNPLPPLGIDTRENVFEIVELYPDFGYLIFIDEEFTWLFIDFIMKRLHKLPDKVSIS